MVVGKLVERAAQSLCATLVASGHLPHDYTPEQFRRAALLYLAEHGSLKSEARYQSPGNIFWDDETYSGEAYPAYAWAVYVAEVAVDTTTYSASVTNFYALQEVGKVLHPILAAGQIEGGVAQGIGYALYEKCLWQNGHLANNQMTNYIIPTSADIPPIHVYLRRDTNPARSVRRKGHRRTPDGWPRPSHPQRHRTRHQHRFHRNPPAPRRHLRAHDPYPRCRHRVPRPRDRRPHLQ